MKRRCKHFLKEGKMCDYTGYKCDTLTNKFNEEAACYWFGFPKRTEPHILK